jgi:hypothetical protein
MFGFDSDYVSPTRLRATPFGEPESDDENDDERQSEGQSAV